LDKTKKEKKQISIALPEDLLIKVDAKTSSIKTRQDVIREILQLSLGV
jgi:metal-responsive CopG/Arc/MetJ family transcriptional regulator